ncbi:MAG: tetratricopeptide repeat protein [Candidatus Omnitrophota bacterium]|nr:tetratricopeptide repeat protein [Candidatus Omnitrophota bacterium]
MFKPRHPAEAVRFSFHAGVVSTLVLLGFIVYSNIVQAPFQFDDKRFVLHNTAIRDAGNLSVIWGRDKTRFIPFWSFALNYSMAGTNVAAYHLTNILIHALNSVLVYFLLLAFFQTPRMRGDPAAKKAQYISAAAAFIFLCHPLQTQAVTYISQRMASLACLFYLATVFFYVKARLSRNGYLLIPALLCAVLAVFTKQNTFTLPFALALCEICFWGLEKESSFKRTLGGIVVFFLPLGVAYLAFFAREDISSSTRMLTDVPRSHYLFSQINVVRTYLRLLILPVGQTIDYDYPLSTTLFEFKTLASLSLHLLLLYLAARSWKRYPLYAFGILWFYLTLSIESSIIPINDLIFEHRVYLPMVGFVAIVPGVVFQMFSSERNARIFLIAAIAAMSVLTLMRNHVWGDDLRLWHDAVEKAPGKSRPYNNLARAYGDRREYKKAFEYITTSLRLNPEDSKAVYNRGIIYAATGEDAKATADFEKAIELGYDDFAELYYNSGRSYGKQGNREKEIEAYRKGLQLDPLDYTIHNAVGAWYLLGGELEEAVPAFLKAAEISPKSAEVQNNLGRLYGDLKQYKKSIEHYLRAMLIDPRALEPYNGIGWVYIQMARFDEAIEYLEKGIEMYPKEERLHKNLANAYLLKGDEKAFNEQLAILKSLKSI